MNSIVGRLRILNLEGPLVYFTEMYKFVIMDLYFPIGIKCIQHMKLKQPEHFYESPESTIISLTMEESLLQGSNTESVGGKDDDDNEW